MAGQVSHKPGSRALEGDSIGPPDGRSLLNMSHTGFNSKMWLLDRGLHHSVLSKWFDNKTRLLIKSITFKSTSVWQISTARKFIFLKSQDFFTVNQWIPHMNNKNIIYHNFGPHPRFQLENFSSYQQHTLNNFTSRQTLIESRKVSFVVLPNVKFPGVRWEPKVMNSWNFRSL